jgi:dephospho-CoA kinase
MPYILGLTGNIASGKTTVGLMLMELGATTYVDADQKVHELYLPGQPLVARLAEQFGPGILNTEGGVDRTRLGELVFGNPEQLKRLEAIVHPAVQSALVERLRALGPDDIGVLDAIKLVESGYAPFCQGVWVVTCPEAVQLQRLMETRGLTEAQARARLSVQPAMERKLAVATEVIHNDSSLDALRAQISAAWQRFRQHIGGAG